MFSAVTTTIIRHKYRLEKKNGVFGMKNPLMYFKQLETNTYTKNMNNINKHYPLEIELI